METYITVPLYSKSLIPEIYVYLPQQTQPAKAVIICGGGGFNHVNLKHEGHQFAQWLNTIGVAGIVLNYRLPNGIKEVVECDLRQAVKVVRSKAADWNIDPQQIGAAGFSIGGLAVSLVAVREEMESKLDFTMLFYSIVSMTDELTHKPSREKLLGLNPSEEDINYFSSEKNVSASTPRCLIMSSNDDNVVSPLNGVTYYQKLKEYNIPAALHVFASGGHGWGMRKEFPYREEMLSLVEKWIKE